MRRHLIGVVVLLAPLLLVGWTPARGSADAPPRPVEGDGGLAPMELSAAATSSSWPAVYHVDTADPVVFVTIDDGWTRSPEAYDAIRARSWPVTSFPLPSPLSADPAYYETIGSPSSFGTHTVNHLNLTTLSYAGQQSEICGGRDAVASSIGSTPGWFRPPYGAWNETTLQAANACGFPGVVLWDVTVDGSSIATTYSNIRAGDIILMHYTPNLALGVATLSARLDGLGLHPAQLAQYLPPVGGTPPVEPPAPVVERRRPVSNDFDGDGKTDVGVLRATAPHAYTWFIRSSATGALMADVFGDPSTGDIAIPADYDGDGRTDVAVLRPGRFDTWYIHRRDGTYNTTAFGQAGDRPVIADFDGDGKFDLAVVRPGTPDAWYIKLSTGGYTSFAFGDHAQGDKVLAPDFTGEGRADPTVRRTDAKGNTHFISMLSTGSYRDVAFGRTTDAYVPGDVDGDWITDLLVVRTDAVTNHDLWFVMRSTGGYQQVDWGRKIDLPIPGDFNGDGRADIAIIWPGVPFIWSARDSTSGGLAALVRWGTNGDKPLSGDESRLVNTAA
jgi:peptidoglycan/xylan/chitin deacetylase (PgdA/CDA1 family)